MSYLKIIIKNNGVYNIYNTITKESKDYSSKGNCMKRLKNLFYTIEKVEGGKDKKIPNMELINALMNSIGKEDDINKDELSIENLKLMKEIEEREKKYKELQVRQKLLDRLQELNANISKMENNFSKMENNGKEMENIFFQNGKGLDKSINDIDLVPSIDSPTMTITKTPLPSILIPSTGEVINPVITGLPKQIRIGHYQKVCDIQDHSIKYKGKSVGRIFYLDFGDFEDPRYKFEDVKGNGFGTIDEFGEFLDNFNNIVPIYHFEEDLNFFKLIGLNTPNFRESPCFCRYNYTPLNPLLNLDEKALYPSIIQYGIVKTRQSVKIFEELF